MRNLLSKRLDGAFAAAGAGAHARPDPSARPDAGFTIVVLLIAITVTSVLLTAAATTWTHVMQREKEQELIWRGGQYVNAIECYIRARGVPPTELEQLVDANCIRKLYSQPLAADGSWRLLRAQAPGMAPVAEEQPRGLLDRNRRSSEPIIGVAAGISGTAIVAYEDSRDYGEWEFTFTGDERPPIRALGLPEGFEQGDPFDTILERMRRERESRQ